MLIKRNFGSFSNDINDSAYNDKTGIYKLKRTIYLFIPKESYISKSFTFGKIVIKNDVVYNSDKSLSCPIRFSEAHSIRDSIYFGTFYTPQPGNIRHPYAKCDINCATTSEHVVMHSDDTTLSFTPSLWNKKVLAIRADDDDDSTYWSLNECLAPESSILLPQYYTDLDMQNRNDDFYSMSSDIDHSYLLSDLIDSNTTIVYMDINKYDTMRLSFQGKMPYVENVCNNSINLGTKLKSSFASFVGNGSTFIYDSDARGMNQDGVMYHGGSVSFGKDYTKKYLVENLGNALDLFSSTCKDLADKYGHIRAMYNPNAIGDKFKVQFKDYKQSPIVTPSEITDAGTINRNTQSNTNPVSGIDNEFTNDVYVTEILSGFQKDELENYNMEVS